MFSIQSTGKPEADSTIITPNPPKSSAVTALAVAKKSQQDEKITQDQSLIAEPLPPIDAALSWQLFMPNSGSFNQEWTRISGDQEKWGMLWAQACTQIKNLIVSDHPTTHNFKDLYLYYGKLRQKVAILQGINDPKYGKYRPDFIHVDDFHMFREYFYPGHLRYADQYIALKNRFTQLYHEGSNDDEDDLNYSKHEETGVFKPRHILTTRKYAMQTISIYGPFINEHGEFYEDVYINLAFVRIAGKFKPTQDNQVYFDKKEDMEYIVGSRIANEKLDDFFRAVEPIYQELRNWNPAKKTSFYEIMGKLIWHMMVMPFYAGSTAVNEGLIRAFEIKNGLTPKAFKAGVTPDFQAYFTPDVGDFAKHFVSLFEGNPDHPHNPFPNEPTAIAKASDNRWQQQKQDKIDMQNMNLVEGAHGCNYPEPIISNKYSKSRRSENMFIHGLTRLELNRQSEESHEKRKLRFVNKWHTWLIQQDSVKRKKEILTKENFIALYYYYFGYFIEEASLQNFVQYIERTPENELNRVCIQYYENQNKLEWLDGLPEAEYKKIYNQLVKAYFSSFIDTKTYSYEDDKDNYLYNFSNLYTYISGTNFQLKERNAYAQENLIQKNLADRVAILPAEICDTLSDEFDYLIKLAESKPDELDKNFSIKKIIDFTRTIVTELKQSKLNISPTAISLFVSILDIPSIVDRIFPIKIKNVSLENSPSLFFSSLKYKYQNNDAILDCPGITNELIQKMQSADGMENFKDVVVYVMNATNKFNKTNQNPDASKIAPSDLRYIPYKNQFLHLIKEEKHAKNYKIQQESGMHYSSTTNTMSKYSLQSISIIDNLTTLEDLVAEETCVTVGLVRINSSATTGSSGEIINSYEDTEYLAVEKIRSDKLKNIYYTAQAIYTNIMNEEINDIKSFYHDVGILLWYVGILTINYAYPEFIAEIILRAIEASKETPHLTFSKDGLCKLPAYLIPNKEEFAKQFINLFSEFYEVTPPSNLDTVVPSALSKASLEKWQVTKSSEAINLANQNLITNSTNISYPHPIFKQGDNLAVSIFRPEIERLQLQKNGKTKTLELNKKIINQYIYLLDNENIDNEKVIFWKNGGASAIICYLFGKHVSIVNIKKEGLLKFIENAYLSELQQIYVTYQLKNQKLDWIEAHSPEKIHEIQEKLLSSYLRQLTTNRDYHTFIDEYSYLFNQQNINLLLLNTDLEKICAQDTCVKPLIKQAVEENNFAVTITRDMDDEDQEVSPASMLGVSWSLFSSLLGNDLQSQRGSWGRYWSNLTLKMLDRFQTHPNEYINIRTLYGVLTQKYKEVSHIVFPNSNALHSGEFRYHSKNVELNPEIISEESNLEFFKALKHKIYSAQNHTNDDYETYTENGIYESQNNSNNFGYLMHAYNVRGILVDVEGQQRYDTYLSMGLINLEDGTDRKEYIAISRMKSIFIEQVFSAIQPLYEQLLNWDGKNERDFYELLGQIFWHLAITKPLEEGNEIVLSILMCILQAKHGIKPRQFNSANVNPNLIALLFKNATDFGKVFLNLFSSQSTLKNFYAVENLNQELTKEWQMIKTNKQFSLVNRNLHPNFKNSQYPAPVFKNSFYSKNNIVSILRPKALYILATLYSKQFSETAWNNYAQEQMELFKNYFIAPEKLKLLKTNGFAAIYFYLFNNYKLEVNNIYVEAIVDFVNKNPMSRLQKICQRYAEKIQKIELLESMLHDVSIAKHNELIMTAASGTTHNNKSSLNLLFDSLSISELSNEIKQVPFASGNPGLISHLANLNRHNLGFNADQESPWDILYSKVDTIIAQNIQLDKAITENAKSFYLYLAEYQERIARCINNKHYTNEGIYRGDLADIDGSISNNELILEEMEIVNFPVLKNRLFQLQRNNQQNPHYGVHKESGLVQRLGTDQTQEYTIESFSIRGKFTNTENIERYDSYVDVGLIQLNNEHNTNYLAITRMANDKLDDFFKTVEPIFQAVLAWHGADENEFYRLLGNLFWHFSLASPLSNHSDIVNIALIRIFETLKGISHKNVKIQIPLDLVSVLMPDPENFITYFSNVFTNSDASIEPFPEAKTTVESVKLQCDIANNNLIDVKNFLYPEPLLKNCIIPAEFPSIFHTEHQQLQLHQQGKMATKQRWNQLTTTLIDYFTSVNISIKKIELLQKDNFIANFYSSYFDRREIKSVNNKFLKFVDFVNNVTLADLEAHYLNYQQNNKKIAWLESFTGENYKNIQRFLLNHYKITNQNASPLRIFLNEVSLDGFARIEYIKSSYRELIKEIQLLPLESQNKITKNIDLINKLFLHCENEKLYVVYLIKQLKTIIKLLRYNCALDYDTIHKNKNTFYIKLGASNLAYEFINSKGTSVTGIISKNALGKDIIVLTQETLNEISSAIIDIITQSGQAELVENWAETGPNNAVWQRVISHCADLHNLPLTYYSENAQEQELLWSLFVPNTKTFNAYWAKDYNQETWGNLWAETCNISAMEVRNKTSVTNDLKSLYMFVSAHRKQVGGIMGAEPTYGVYRLHHDNDSDTTYREFFYKGHARYDEQYIPLKNKFLKVINEHKEDDDSYSVHKETGIYYSRSLKSTRRYSLQSYTIYNDFINAQGMKRKDAYINIGLIHLEGAYENNKFNLAADTEYMVGARIHSDNLDDFFRGADPVYQELLNYQGPDNQHFYRLLGRLLWHLASPMPLLYGSTAVNEAIVRIFEIARGIKPAVFKTSVTPDFRAYFSPDREEFANTFLSLFEGQPDIVNDTFPIEATAEIKADHANWLGLKAKNNFPYYNQSLFDDNTITPEPMFRNNIGAWHETAPNIFQNPGLRIRIVRSGLKSLKYFSDKLKEYYFSLPAAHSPEIMNFLKNGGFDAISNELRDYQRTRHKEQDIKNINEYISNRSLSTLIDIRKTYFAAKNNYTWLNSLPQQESQRLQGELFETYLNSYTNLNPVNFFYQVSFDHAEGKFYTNNVPSLIIETASIQDEIKKESAAESVNTKKSLYIEKLGNKIIFSTNETALALTDLNIILINVCANAAEKLANNHSINLTKLYTMIMDDYRLSMPEKHAIQFRDFNQATKYSLVSEKYLKSSDLYTRLKNRLLYLQYEAKPEETKSTHRNESGIIEDKSKNKNHHYNMHVLSAAHNSSNLALVYTDLEENMEYIAGVRINASQLNEIFTGADYYFKTILALPEKSDEAIFYVNLSNLVWNLAWAQPSISHSNTLLEILIRTLEVFKGIQPKTLATNIPLDVLALFCTNKDDFTKIFLDLLNDNAEKMFETLFSNVPSALAIEKDNQWLELIKSKSVTMTHRNLIYCPELSTFPEPLFNENQLLNPTSQSLFWRPSQRLEMNRYENISLSLHLKGNIAKIKDELNKTKDHHEDDFRSQYAVEALLVTQYSSICDIDLNFTQCKKIANEILTFPEEKLWLMCLDYYKNQVKLEWLFSLSSSDYQTVSPIIEALTNTSSTTERYPIIKHSFNDLENLAPYYYNKSNEALTCYVHLILQLQILVLNSVKTLPSTLVDQLAHDTTSLKDLLIHDHDFHLTKTATHLRNIKNLISKYYATESKGHKLTNDINYTKMIGFIDILLDSTQPKIILEDDEADENDATTDAELKDTLINIRKITDKNIMSYGDLSDNKLDKIYKDWALILKKYMGNIDGYITVGLDIYASFSTVISKCIEQSIKHNSSPDELGYLVQNNDAFDYIKLFLDKLEAEHKQNYSGIINDFALDHYLSEFIAEISQIFKPIANKHKKAIAQSKPSHASLISNDSQNIETKWNNIILLGENSIRTQRVDSQNLGKFYQFYGEHRKYLTQPSNYDGKNTNIYRQKPYQDIINTYDPQYLQLKNLLLQALHAKGNDNLYSTHQDTGMMYSHSSGTWRKYWSQSITIYGLFIDANQRIYQGAYIKLALIHLEGTITSHHSLDTMHDTEYMKCVYMHHDKINDFFRALERNYQILLNCKGSNKNEYKALLGLMFWYLSLPMALSHESVAVSAAIINSLALAHGVNTIELNRNHALFANFMPNKEMFSDLFANTFKGIIFDSHEISNNILNDSTDWLSLKLKHTFDKSRNNLIETAQHTDYPEPLLFDRTVSDSINSPSFLRPSSDRLYINREGSHLAMEKNWQQFYAQYRNDFLALYSNDSAKKYICENLGGLEVFYYISGYFIHDVVDLSLQKRHFITYILTTLSNQELHAVCDFYHSIIAYISMTETSQSARTEMLSAVSKFVTPPVLSDPIMLKLAKHNLSKDRFWRNSHLFFASEEKREYTVAEVSVASAVSTAAAPTKPSSTMSRQERFAQLLANKSQSAGFSNYDYFQPRINLSQSSQFNFKASAYSST